MPEAKLVQVATMVPDDLAEAIRSQAQANERSAAAEMRLALRAWVEQKTANA